MVLGAPRHDVTRANRRYTYAEEIEPEGKAAPALEEK